MVPLGVVFGLPIPPLVAGTAEPGEAMEEGSAAPARSLTTSASSSWFRLA